MDEEHPVGWTKPKQSFRLKKTIPRGRPVLGSANSNRTLPIVPSQSVKRRNSFDKDDIENNSVKKQRLGDIFSASSNFIQNQTLPCPSALQRRVSESSLSTGSRGNDNVRLFL